MGCGHKKIKRKGKNKTRQKTIRTSVPDDGGIGTIPVVVIPELPRKCPNCGAPVEQKNLQWIGPTTAKCSYCEATLTVNFRKIT